jgi:N6-adenosine-specific RNA methylase IME4
MTTELTAARQKWSGKINAAWQKSVAGILETGELLILAKADEDLPHGEWLPMVESDLIFGKSTAQKLMKIAGDNRLLKAEYTPLLPPAWGTLFELTRLKGGEWGIAEKRGLIRPDVEQKEVKDFIRELRRAETTAARQKEVGNVEGVYSLIYVDPPWKYEHPISDSRKVENQYPTELSTDLASIRVRGRRIPELAHNDCVLLMWATSPKLAEAVTLMDAWGFSYRTNLVWVKDRIGMGYWFRQQHELLLLGVKGKPPVPLPGTQASSVFTAPRPDKHSEKPTGIYELIETTFPSYRKLELFARGERDGWDRWGNE